MEPSQPPARGNEQSGDRLGSEGIVELEKKLTQAVTYLENIIKKSPDPSLTTDMDGRIFEFNRAAEKLTGYGADEAGERNISEIMGRRFDFSGLRDGLIRDPLCHLETEMVTREGKRIPVKLSASTLDSGDGSPMGMFFMARDVSEQKAMQRGILDANRRLMRAMKRIQEKDRMKSDFILLLRHEINTPLAVLKGMLSLWHIKDMFTPEQLEKLPRLERQIKRLEDLSDRMKEIDILHMEITNFVMEEFEARTMLEDILENQSTLLESKGHETFLEAPGGIWVTGDRLKMERNSLQRC